MSNQNLSPKSESKTAKFGEMQRNITKTLNIIQEECTTCYFIFVRFISSSNFLTRLLNVSWSAARRRCARSSLLRSSNKIARSLPNCSVWRAAQSLQSWVCSLHCLKQRFFSANYPVVMFVSIWTFCLCSVFLLLNIPNNHVKGNHVSR